MKSGFTFFLLISAASSFAQNSNVGIGTTAPAPSAALDVSSTDKGLLVPRMTSDQRKLISAPATGLLVFDNTTSSFWFRNATGWVELVDSTKQPWQKSGGNVYVNNGENVGIGTPTPTQKLEVAGTVKAASFKAEPATGGLSIGSDANGSTLLRAGISQAAAGYGYVQSVKAENVSWGDLALNPNGGNVGIGTTTPSAKLEVEGDAKVNIHLTVDANNHNAGTTSFALRFGSNATEAIGSKRTIGGNLNGRLSDGMFWLFLLCGALRAQAQSSMPNFEAAAPYGSSSRFITA